MAAVTILAVTGVAFVSTNVDNLVLLLGFLGRGEARGGGNRAIVMGYVGAMGIVIGGSWLVAEGADWLRVIPWEWVGVVPISLGVLELWKWRRRDQGLAMEPKGEEEERNASLAMREERDAETMVRTADPTGGASVLAVGAVMVANGGDTAAVFLSMFLESQDRLGVEIFATGMVCAAAWGGLAVWFSGHPATSRWVLPVAQKMLPFLLIAVGIYILLDTGTDIGRR